MVDSRPTTITPPRHAHPVVRPAPDACEVLEQRVDNLQRALHHSRRIGAATGILMALQGWRYEEAFEWLRRPSQSSNRKVSDLADEIVLTGTVEVEGGAGNSSGASRPRPA